MYCSIVLYHHTYQDIRKTLNSLLGTTNCQKIILVDNGGCEWANYLDNSKIIYLKSPKNGGFGYGHNLAIKRYAKYSEFFLICNPDIYFEPNQLDNLVSIAKQRKEGLFSPKICNPDGTNQYAQHLLPTSANLFARRFLAGLGDKLDEAYLLKSYHIYKPCFMPACSGCFMLFCSTVLLKLGGFDERYFMYLEDFDLSRRCAEKFDNCYVPTVIIYHKHTRGSYKDKQLLKYHIQSALKYFNKWGWLIDKQRSHLNQKAIMQFSSE